MSQAYQHYQKPISYSVHNPSEMLMTPNHAEPMMLFTAKKLENVNCIEEPTN